MFIIHLFSYYKYFIEYYFNSFIRKIQTTDCNKSLPLDCAKALVFNVYFTIATRLTNIDINAYRTIVIMTYVS